MKAAAGSVARRLRQAALAAGLGLALGVSPPTAAAEPVYPGRTWTEATPESVGWSSERFKAADELARAIGSDAYLVVVNGVIVHSYGAVTRPMNLASARKSVLSVLYGIESDRGHVDLDRTLADLGIGDRRGLSATEKTATVRQLLQSRSGVYHPAAYEMAAMKAARPERGSHAPGTFWYYNNWDFNALGTIFQQLSGHSVFEALDLDLAQPLGFEDFRAAKDTEFVRERSSDHPAYVMRLSARDLARIGLLMARDGSWQGRRIVSTRWIRESTTSYSDTAPGVGYGYLWWVGQDGWHFAQRFPGPVYSARGNFGQYLIVDAPRDLVVVHRVDMDRFMARSVDNGDFGRLLGKILAAAPPGF